jgi:hypothetical protein
MERLRFKSRTTALHSWLGPPALVLLMAAQSRAANPWNASQVIQPATLAKELARPAGRDLKILQVGFRTLYEQGHIPGALYCGPASRQRGIARLKRCLARIPKTADIVLYCGCCPWQECPNIRPAFKTLKAMGYTHVEVVEIKQNFGHDWKARSYPTRSGRNP